MEESLFIGIGVGYGRCAEIILDLQNSCYTYIGSVFFVPHLTLNYFSAFFLPNVYISRNWHSNHISNFRQPICNGDLEFGKLSQLVFL